jgi:hypothetical protein
MHLPPKSARSVYTARLLITWRTCRVFICCSALQQQQNPCPCEHKVKALCWCCSIGMLDRSSRSHQASLTNLRQERSAGNTVKDEAVCEPQSARAGYKRFTSSRVATFRVAEPFEQHQPDLVHTRDIYISTLRPDHLCATLMCPGNGESMVSNLASTWSYKLANTGRA